MRKRSESVGFPVTSLQLTYHDSDFDSDDLDIKAVNLPVTRPEAFNDFS